MSGYSLGTNSARIHSTGISRIASPRLIAAFVLSGMAGLAYEVLWTRYLSLFVGHSAYAQILVMCVYLGGMAIGAFLVSDISRKVRRPLRWYAGAEVGLAVAAVGFHTVYSGLTDLGYDHLFTGLESGGAIGAARWGIAGLLILPQSVVLGATFPFMAAALKRRDPQSAGRSVAIAYFCNTLGGAAGVLITGFGLIGWFGLSGAMVVAGVLSTVAAGLALVDDTPVAAASVEASDPVPVGASPRPAGVLFLVAFATALASFAYEIGWIRMLALVLGSATHAFELMLSAFILGLALGAWWIRTRIDPSRDPVRLLGVVQVVMGIGAALSLPLYALTFSAMGFLVDTLPASSGGYAVFNVARYGLCLLVMLPATVAAGMTLPLITGTLLRWGRGERSIGRVYAANTLGSVAGVSLAGLVLLPLVGLRGLVLGGAALDVLLGLTLLTRATVPVAPIRLVAWAGAAAVVFGGVVIGADVDQRRLTSGVFRYGEGGVDDGREMLYYRDGRTATVSAHVVPPENLIVLATNGKPDASLGTRWFAPGADTMPPAPLERARDYTTQVLAPVIGLAHVTDARSAAVIGHGSGMSGRALLTAPALERLVTIEIEPLMVEGSMVFVPENGPVFEDPRSTFVFDDARSYLSAGRERFDLVFAEPSNPWVSGIAGLFSTEFYERMSEVVAPGGVLAQWVHLYELDDDLFLSIMAALQQSFQHYRVYAIGPADVVVIASAQAFAGGPDWAVLETEAFREMTRGLPPFRATHLDATFLFDDELIGPVVRQVVPHSDFRPILDLRAERTRFMQSTADGALSFATDRIDPGRAFARRRALPSPYALVPARGLRPALDEGHAAWMREVLDSGGGVAPPEYPGWERTLRQVRNLFLALDAFESPTRGDWLAFLREFQAVEGYLHWGTSGWADERLYGRVHTLLDREEAPTEVHAAVDLLYGASTWDWERAAAAADEIVAPVAAGEFWLAPDLVLDAAVLAYAYTGRVVAGRNALRILAPMTGRSEGNLRYRVLESLLDRADQGAVPPDPGSDGD